MIKIKMVELINAYQVLNKIGDSISFNISMQFKFKVAFLIKYLKDYIEQYNKELQNLIQEYGIKIDDNRFINEDKDKLNSFLIKLNELDNMELEIEHEQILMDENVNGISANELVYLIPFFDFSRLE